MKKIIIDTNWWVSFIVSKKSHGLPAFFFGDIFFCFSIDLTAEIKNTLQYTRIVKRINQKNLEAYNFFEKNIEVFFSPEETITICRDPKDNFLLALAKDAGADYLITRDEDLLSLKKFENTFIITLDQFIKTINET
jgi:putative PIN family toxin of toxin-antitoxin system